MSRAVSSRLARFLIALGCALVLTVAGIALLGDTAAAIISGAGVFAVMMLILSGKADTRISTIGLGKVARTSAARVGIGGVLLLVATLFAQSWLVSALALVGYACFWLAMIVLVRHRSGS